MSVSIVQTVYIYTYEIGSQLLYDPLSLSVVDELVLTKELTLVEWSQTVDADLSGLGCVCVCVHMYIYTYVCTTP